MKKTLLSAVLAATFGFVAIAPQAAAASDGTITFKGQVTDTTCTVTGGAGTDKAAQDITVTLNTVSTTSLTAAGQRAGDTPFSLIVGGSGQTGCADNKIASLRFETAQSTQINAATGNLKNTGAATNVEVGLLNDSKAIIDLRDSTNSTKATIANNTATLSYFAQYVATGAAGAGDVNTNVVYSLTYN